MGVRACAPSAHLFSPLNLASHRLNAQADSSGNVYLEQHLTPTQHAGRNGGKDPQAQFNSFIGCESYICVLRESGG